MYVCQNRRGDNYIACLAATTLRNAVDHEILSTLLKKDLASSSPEKQLLALFCVTNLRQEAYLNKAIQGTILGLTKSADAWIRKKAYAALIALTRKAQIAGESLAIDANFPFTMASSLEKEGDFGVLTASIPLLLLHVKKSEPALRGAGEIEHSTNAVSSTVVATTPSETDTAASSPTQDLYPYACCIAPSVAILHILMCKESERECDGTGWREVYPDYRFYSVPCPWLIASLLRFLAVYPLADCAEGSVLNALTSMLLKFNSKVVESALSTPSNRDKNVTIFSIFFAICDLVVEQPSMRGSDLALSCKSILYCRILNANDRQARGDHNTFAMALASLAKFARQEENFFGG